MTNEIVLTVPARLLTPGDQTRDHSISQKHTFPDGTLEFRFVVPFTTHYMTVIIQKEHVDAIFFPLIKRGDFYNPNPRNEALGLPPVPPKPYVAPEPIARYAAGSRVGDVQHFDRGMKISFHCPQHPDQHFYSKDPFVSNWFGTGGCPKGCDTKTADMILDVDYLPTRNG